MKKEVIFVAHHLTIGGVQKSLISALRALDYSEYNVYLYLRKNRLDLLDYVDKRANVIVNKNNKHYYRTPKAIYLNFMKSFFSLIKNKDKEKFFQNGLNKYIVSSMMADEEKLYFKDKSYDIAIAYAEGYTALFVEKHIKAKKKIVFYQSSTDEIHDVNDYALPKFDSIVVEHEDIKKLIPQWYNNVDKKQITIHENYTSPEFLREQSKEFDISTYDDKITIATCARFASVKGLDLAVKAAKILKDKNCRFVWYLVGDGPEMPFIKQLIEDYKLSGYVILEGMKKNPYPYMAGCDIYVQPSREEALSIAMLESQMLCAPMVSTRTVGGEAMIVEGQNGLLADIDEVSLAEAIERLIVDNKLRNQIKQNLCGIDYSLENKRYRDSWNKLLEN